MTVAVKTAYNWSAEFPDEPGPAAAEDDAPRTWRPVDPEPYLTGSIDLPQPTVGRRTDGRGLLYPGRIHTWAGESEAGKGWLAVGVIVAELDAGNAATVVDFEDEAGTWYGRLLAAGAKREQLRDQFAYIAPEEPIGSERSLARGDLGQALGDLTPSFVLLDGTTDAMTLHRLDPLSNKDAALFGRMLPRWIARRGPATVASDHVTKDREGRGRYALGAVHKLNGVDGACYILENRHAFGVGISGRSTLLIAKDRPAGLRQHALPSSGGLHWYGDLAVKSHATDFVEVELAAPNRAPGETKPFHPTSVMAKVSAILAAHPAGMSKNLVETTAGGKKDILRAALELLVTEGYARVERRGPAHLHFHVKPFTDGDEPEGN